jgi:hypothetical protein
MIMPAALVGGMALAGLLAVTAAIGRGPVTPTEPPTNTQAARRTTPRIEEPVVYRGRVLGPDETPVVGAKVYYLCATHADVPVGVRAVTDAAGRFSFSIGEKDIPPSADASESDPRKTGQLVAKADGLTFGWQTRPAKPDNVELRLSRDDAPVEGRFVDLQGKPVAGMRVTAQSAAMPKTGSLDDFIKALRGGESFYPAMWEHAQNWLNEPLARMLPGLLPTTTTDAEGRFRLTGFAREWAVTLRVDGAGAEVQNLCVLNRAGIADRRLSPFLAAKDAGLSIGDGRKVIVFGNGFVHPVAPGQTIVGTITDESGNTLPRVMVESYMLAGTNLAQNTVYHTIADDKGRYRLEGLPRGKGNRIRIRPPEDLSYLPVVKDVPAAAPFAEATVDAVLQRGVRVEITATDKDTGRPVAGSVSYFAIPPKRTFIPLPGSDAYDDFMPTRTDGTLRLVVAPRKAIIAFRTDWEKYPIPREATTIWLPSGLSPTNYAAFAEINPNAGDGPVRVDFKLDPGRSVTGKLTGPDGNAVDHAWAAPLRTDWWPFDNANALKSDTFKAIGVDPARPRLLCFVQREKKLAGSVVVHGDEPGPVTVRLQPSASVSGRLLDAEGRPIRNARLAFTEVPVGNPARPMSTETGFHVVLRASGQPDLDPKTDDIGRFRADGLVAGLKHNLARYDAAGATGFEEIRWLGLAFRGLVFKPGEDRDLGDVRLQPMPKD